MNQIWLTSASHLLCILSLLVLGGVTLRLRSRLRQRTAECIRERRLRAEMEAYAALDPSTDVLPAEGMSRKDASQALAKRVCRVIAEKSLFPRVGLMLRDPGGRLSCAGSIGVDDLTVQALNAWGEQMGEEDGREIPGDKSFAIALGEWSRFDPEVADWKMAGKRERRRWRRALAAPLRIGSGQMMGALIVCADGPRGGAWKQVEQGLERAMGPIEALACRLAISLENERLWQERELSRERVLVPCKLLA